MNKSPRARHGVKYLPIPKSAVPNDGITLGIKSHVFSLPTLPVLQVSF